MSKPLSQPLIPGRIGLLSVLPCLLLGFLLIMLVGCTRPATHTDIRFAIAQAPLTLDPRYATDAASERINRLVYRQLVDFDVHSRPVPALAHWTCTDALHCRFVLGQQGRTFHDGQRLTADDVAATYQSLLALKDSPHAEEFANIDTVRAVDADTVDFTLKHADDQFPARLIIGILPARLIAEHHDFSRQPLGSGPLQLMEWHRTLKFKRLQDGQDIVLEEVRDPTVRVLKLLRGEIDLVQGDLPPELVTYLKHQAGIKVEEVAGTNFSYLGFNLQDPVLRDQRVRRAVTLAIDRDSIISQALIAETRPATAILPPEHWAGNPDLKPYPYDPDQARQLLQEAGIKLPLKLVYKTSTDAQRVRLATIMQAQLRKAGIDLEIRSLDWGTFFDDVKHGKFQLYGLTWVGIKTPEIYRLAFHSESVPPRGANRGRLVDPVLDQMVNDGRWQLVTEYVHSRLPYVPLWYEGQFAAMHTGLKKYQPQADGNWDGLSIVTKTP